MKGVFISILLFVTCSVAAGQNASISEISITDGLKTQSKIIRRELPFAVGDTLSMESLRTKVLQGKENLMNTSLFNSVEISLIELHRDTLCTSFRVDIALEERWYTWPVFEMRLEDRNMSSWVKKMDWKRITYVGGIKVSNMFGLGHKLELRGKFGWERGGNIKYSRVPIGRYKKWYLAAEFETFSNKHADYITINDKPLQLSSQHTIYSTIGANASITFRPDIRTRHSLNLSYSYQKIDNTLLEANKEYWGNGGLKRDVTALTYNFTYDQRDYIYYPTTGFMIGGELHLEQANSFSFRYGRATMDMQYYSPVSQRWFWSSRIKLSASAKNRNAYLYNKAVGYGNANICGFELYVIDGEHFITQNNSLSYLILPKKSFYLGLFPKWRKINRPHITIYGKVMSDFGYVWSKNQFIGNKYPNKFLAGWGAAIDIVSYYDIVINFGYGVNNWGRNHFIFGFKSPIF